MFSENRFFTEDLQVYHTLESILKKLDTLLLLLQGYTRIVEYTNLFNLIYFFLNIIPAVNKVLNLEFLGLRYLNYLLLLAGHFRRSNV